MAESINATINVQQLLRKVGKEMAVAVVGSGICVDSVDGGNSSRSDHDRRSAKDKRGRLIANVAKCPD